MSANRPLFRALTWRRTVALPISLRNLLYGGLVGAAVMLLILPASRPFFIGAVTPSPLDRALASMASIARGTRLPTPKSLTDQAMWFSVAAGRIRHGREVTQAELQTVETMMATAADAEPSNAFWLQADAALLERLGRRQAAEAAWLGAARRLRWDDHQNDYLNVVLADRQDAPAYAYAELYRMRTACAAQLIYESESRLLTADWDEPKLNIQMRLATVLNGNLIRRRAKSIDAMRVGAQIIETAVSKPTDESDTTRNPKVLVIAREKFYRAVATAGLGYDHDTIERIFEEADAARYLATIEDAPSTMQVESVEAAILHTAPGAILLCELLGIAIFGIRWIYGRLVKAESGKPWLPIACMTVLGIGAALFLTSAYAAFALGLCIVFAASTPAHVRKRRPVWLGPFFWLMTSSVAGVLLLAGTGGLMLHSAPGRVLFLPVLPRAFDGPAAVCGVVALAIGFLFLCGPLWAFAQRLPTNYVLGLGLRDIGLKLVLTSLLLGVVSAPTCVFLDRLLGERIRNQFNNEFLYYYQKFNPKA